MDKEKLIDEVKDFVSKNIMNLAFHNFEHTTRVAAGVREIVSHEKVSEHDAFLIEIAAWFHDVGYTAPKCSHHEENGVHIAEDYLKGKLSDEDIKTIKGCIFATRLNQNPTTHLESILSDADLLHLGKDDFFEQSELLRQELSDCSTDKKFSKKQWMTMNLQFMSEIKYHTDYAKGKYEPLKRERQNEIRAQIDNLLEKGKKLKKEGKKDVVVTPPKPRRDIETLYRVLTRNQLGLSAIADRKASILLSINSIITSFAIGYLFRKIDQYPQLMIPSLLLATTGLVSVILAVIATRPNVGVNKKKNTGKVNLLFFENFVDMPLEEYQSALVESTKTPNDVYENLSRDSYYLGKVLAVKYKRVRFAFNFFMFGLTATVISFIISFLLV